MVYGRPGRHTWYMVWPGTHDMVYAMARQAWPGSHNIVYCLALQTRHSIWYGLAGTTWYMLLPGRQDMVIGMAWHARDSIWYGLAGTIFFKKHKSFVTFVQVFLIKCFLAVFPLQSHRRPNLTLPYTISYMPGHTINHAIISRPYHIPRHACQATFNTYDVCPQCLHGHVIYHIVSPVTGNCSF